MLGSVSTCHHSAMQRLQQTQCNAMIAVNAVTEENAVLQMTPQHSHEVEHELSSQFQPMSTMKHTEGEFQFVVAP